MVKWKALIIKKYAILPKMAKTKKLVLILATFALIIKASKKDIILD